LYRKKKNGRQEYIFGKKTHTTAISKITRAKIINYTLYADTIVLNNPTFSGDKKLKQKGIIAAALMVRSPVGGYAAKVKLKRKMKAAVAFEAFDNNRIGVAIHTVA